MWKYLPEGWPTETQLQGWNADGVVQAYKAGVQNLQAQLQSSPILNHSNPAISAPDRAYFDHNIYMSYAYVLALASQHKDKLSLLDWGGAIGQYYLISKKLMPEVSFDYHIKDVPLLCQEGSQQFPEIKFYSNDKCLDRSYDLVLASGSLQYSQNWQSVFKQLSQSASPYLYLTRIPVVQHHSSFVVAQAVYNTIHAGWFLNKNELLDIAQKSGLRLLREFSIDIPFQPSGAPEACQQAGFLFKQQNRIPTQPSSQTLF
ncbi:methyltransferase, TIGR04325 family [Sodalinema gerasimenkoae]|uniref:methyltransferase, TIGR04325 family n=1 Tax=Sodalinema gerasimenkoae TaxID=2862348 RepID=UPI00135A9B31|nr:methyltransferase, TIGR04325 family [Sodalinema gerasimenkoae]